MIRANEHFVSYDWLEGSVVALALVLVVALLGLWSRGQQRREGPPRRSYLRRRKTRATEPHPFRNLLTQATAPPAVSHLQSVAAFGYETVPLLNGTEARYLPLIEGVLAEAGRGHRVMAQTAMGEILRPTGPQGPERDAAFAAINAKRLDFAVLNRAGHLVAAVEVQGLGHYQNAAFLRDAVKREAVRKAGVPFIEVEPDMPDEELRSRLRRAIGATDQRQGSGAAKPARA